MKYGKVTRPVLGISFAPEQAVEQLGVSGVLVLDAPPNGPAGKAVSILLSCLFHLLIVVFVYTFNLEELSE